MVGYNMIYERDITVMYICTEEHPKTPVTPHLKSIWHRLIYWAIYPQKDAHPIVYYIFLKDANLDAIAIEFVALTGRV